MDHRLTRRQHLSAGYDWPTCPRCGSPEGFRSVTVQDSGRGSGLSLLFFGGLVAYLLYNSYRQPQNQILCDRCGLVFQPTVRTTPRNAVVVAFAIAALLGLILFLWSWQAGLYP